jgi:hypothetical protein
MGENARHLGDFDNLSSGFMREITLSLDASG